MSDATGSPSRLAMGFIIATILIDGMGVGLIFPVMPDLIREVTGRALADAAIWGGVLATGYAVMQFFFGPIVGNLSDRFGRRPVLISALVVLGIDYLVMAVAPTIWFLLVGRLLAGMTAATYSTAAAYVADVSPPAKRDQNFGRLGAAMGVGFALGPMVGGLLSGIDTRAPFYAAAALALANALFGLIVMPESLEPDKRRPFKLSRANPFGAFRALGALKGVGPLLLLFAVAQVAYFVYPAVWAFFGQAQFGFDAQMVGLTLFAFGLSMGVSQAFLIGPIVARIGSYRTAMATLLLDIAVLAVIGLTDTIWLMWVLTVMAGFTSIAMVAIQSITSRAVPDDQQGELQGVLGALAALAMIVSPLLMTQTFAAFTHEAAPLHLPGAPFLLAAALLAICALVLWRWRAGVGAALD
ncbi:MFS transporter [Celeribacter sp.]|uniref:MFS transporter n=1 Tax=Celeribacter sp. TaxID=1890673 RepID=UPI003A91F308